MNTNAGQRQVQRQLIKNSDQLASSVRTRRSYCTDLQSDTSSASVVAAGNSARPFRFIFSHKILFILPALHYSYGQPVIVPTELVGPERRTTEKRGRMSVIGDLLVEYGLRRPRFDDTLRQIIKLINNNYRKKNL